tara:strand:- start:581 stop:1066 length:486 start_codon:yes stop_codon:yes gene_type:complete
MEITTTSNEVHLNYSEAPKKMIISYSGSFVGEVFGDCIVRLSRKNIIIEFQEDPPSLLMSYTGKFAIISVSAYDKMDNTIYTNRVVKEDKWNLIVGDYANNTNKYPDYNQSIGYNFVDKTLLAYKHNNEQHYLNQKGMLRPDRDSMEIKKLNRIRGNYGIK